MVNQYGNLFGDTAALCLPTRKYAIDAILKDSLVASRLLHGSDWPVIALPPPTHLGVSASIELMREKNWMRRDVLIKQRWGFGDDYWHRAAKVLRLSKQITA